MASFLEVGQQQLQVGFYQAALRSFEQAIELDPQKAEAWQGKAEALKRLSRYEESNAALERAIELQMAPLMSAEFWFQQGNKHYMARDYTTAIASYDQALHHKPDYTDAWNNRGGILAELGRCEEAIASYDQALKYKPNYHEAWNNRGIALGNLGRYEEAITSYDQALLRKPDDHLAWYNRGVALLNLGRYEEAITSFDHALHHKPDFHLAWCNRGVALDNLERYEEAVASYDHALHHKPDLHLAWRKLGIALLNLERYEEAVASFDHALHHKPDDHLVWNGRGVALLNLGRYEEAITSFDHALHHKPDFHLAWNGRGVALGILKKHKEAIASYEVALKHKPDDPLAWLNRGNELGNERRYEAAVNNYDEGLKHVHQDVDPEGWGRLQQGKGVNYYRWESFQPCSGLRFRQALTCYKLALQILTAETFPKRRLEVIQVLIRVCLGLKDTETANDWRDRGLQLLGDLLNAAPSPERKRQIEHKFSGFSQIGVDVLVQAGQPVTALETADRYKNRCLMSLLEAWQEQTVSPSHAQMRQLLTPTTAIVYWHLSPHALTTFLLLPHQPDPIALSSPKSLDEFTQWQKDWDQHYTDYRQTKTADATHPWRTNLTANLDRLKQILEIDAIVPHLSHTTHLILVPHRDLHRFPLHIFFPEHTCTHLPSLQVGLNLQQLHPNPPVFSGTSLLNIDDPATGLLDPLPYAQLESALIRQLINGPTTLQSPTQATAIAAIAALQQPHQIFHFTGHGEYNFRQPQNSRLALAQQTHLTAAEISPLNLEPYQLICIAACETALTGRETIETEYVGLVSAFLKARAANVLSTLWVVNEISSAWLMIQFYQRLLSPATPTPAIALQQAQTWLRTRTTANLLLWITDLHQFMSTRDPAYCKDLQDEITALQSKLDTMEVTPADRPYENPYHWAAFTLTGTPYESH